MALAETDAPNGSVAGLVIWGLVMISLASRWPEWLKVVFAVPAAVMMAILICWNPGTKKQWLWAAGMAGYVALYYFVIIR